MVRIVLIETKVRVCVSRQALEGPGICWYSVRTPRVERANENFILLRSLQIASGAFRVLKWPKLIVPNKPGEISLCRTGPFAHERAQFRTAKKGEQSGKYYIWHEKDNFPICNR